MFIRRSDEVMKLIPHCYAHISHMTSHAKGNGFLLISLVLLLCHCSRVLEIYVHFRDIQSFCK